MPYELNPEFLEELFTKHRIDYVVHGDDPCLLPDGSDAYAHAKEMGRFKMVSTSVPVIVATAASAVVLVMLVIMASCLLKSCYADCYSDSCCIYADIVCDPHSAY